MLLQTNRISDELKQIIGILQRVGKFHYFLIIAALILVSTTLDALVVIQLANLEEMSDIDWGVLLLVGARFVFMFMSLYLSIDFSYSTYHRLCDYVFETVISHKNYVKVVTDRDSFTRIINADILMVSRGYILQLVYILTDTLTLLFVSVALLSGYSVEYLLLAAATILIFAVIQYLLSRYTKRLGEFRSTFDQKRYNLSREALQMLDSLVVSGTKGFFVKKFSETVYQFARSLRISTFIIQSARLQLELVLCILAALTFLLFSAIHEEISLGMLAALGFSVLRIVPALSRVSSSTQQISFAQPALRNLTSVLPNVESSDLITDKKPFEQLEIQVTDATNIELAKFIIEKGQRYAVTGPSGVGKSSFLKELLGLGSFSGGSFAIASEPDIANLKCAYVPQEVNLFNSSLLENVTLKPASDTSNRDKAFVGELLRDLGMPYNDLGTPLGADASILSGGERQRVSVARAIYQQPDVLLMDEFSSALDIENAQRVLKACSHYCETIIYISHDATMVAAATHEIRIHKRNSYELIKLEEENGT